MHTPPVIKIVVGLMAALVPAAQTLIAAPPVYTTVANSGDVAPGTGSGVTFFQPYYPLIGNDGTVGFHGYLQGPGVTAGVNDEGLWLGQPGTLAMIARIGSQAPPLEGGVNYAFFDNFNVNSSGQAMFYAALLGTANNEAFFRVSGSTTTVFLRIGDAAPGIGGGVSILGFASGEPAFNGAGQIAVAASLTGAGVNAGNSDALWIGAPPGSLALVARKGDAAPGLGAGVLLGSLSSFKKVLNDAGQVVFASTVSGTGVTTSNDSAMWRGVAGSVTLIVREGSVAPGLGGSILIGQVLSGEYGINTSGQVAFNSGLTAGGVTAANNEALWVGTPGSLTLVARKGDSAPGMSGVPYGSFERISVNASGAVMFRSVTPSGHAVFAGMPGSISLIFGPGMQAPGAPAGVTYAVSNGSSSQHLNDSGNVAALAKVSGTGVTSANDFGVWVQDGATLRPILREGDSYEVSPGVFKTVAFVGLTTDAASPQDGSPRVFSNQNKLVMIAAFTDNTTADILADLSGGPATGACCTGSACSIMTQTACESGGGTYLGNGSSCTGNPCVTLQACCLPNGTCADLSTQDCTTQGGTSQGVGSTCAKANCPTVACCLPNGTCDNLSIADCATQGGISQGAGSTCATAFCPTGACCMPDGSCVNHFSETTCLNAGGLNFTPGFLCAQVQCLDRPCCLPNGSCVILDPGFCAGMGGQPGGFNITCAQAGCEMPGDADGDGMVNIIDLTIIILNWGPCDPKPNPCPGDLNNDSIINILDLTEIILNWSL